METVFRFLYLSAYFIYVLSKTAHSRFSTYSPNELKFSKSEWTLKKSEWPLS